jgi:beta-glucosidase
VVSPQYQELQSLVERLSLEEKVHLLTGQDSWSLRALPSIGLRSIVMSDGPAGVRGSSWDERDPSVNFPSPTSVAASWDRDSVRAVGEGLGSEARRKGVHVVLAPTINLHRTPYGGRHFEAFSEDPLLTSELATEYVLGIQSHGVGATVKHYVANDSETDRFTVDVRVSDRALREVYLAAFEGPVVEGHAWLVMSAYNSINGATATENTLLTSPLQDDWGFDGVVVSDWTAVRSIESARHPQDVAMPGPRGAWGDQLVDAVRHGRVNEAVIDRKVCRVLLLAARVGALDGFKIPERAPVAPAADLNLLARSASSDGMVLLSNDGVLPLSAPRSVAVFGEGARFARTQGGGSATVIPAAVVSPLEGIRRRWPNAEITWNLGAVARKGLAPLEPGTFVAPDGSPGLEVRYLDSDGRELGREIRQTSWLVWFDGVSVATSAATVELAFRFLRGDASRLGIGGLADFEVLMDGESIATGELRTKPGDDPATAVLNPPFTTIDLPPTDTETDVLVRFRPVPGGIPDSLALRVGLPPVEASASELIADAVEAAARADVAVVIVGTSNEVESEGFDRESLSLPGAQDDLVRAVAAVNPRTVVVVNSGAPVTLPWRDEVAATLAVWFPGQEFGDALADVLSGDAEPGGRLPVTWPSVEVDVPVRDVTPVDGRLEYLEGVHIGDRAWRRAGVRPAFAFGHGLGYTSWDLIDLEGGLEADDGSTSAAVTVRNTGGRAGKCVVQLYLERPASRVERPARWLAGFEVVRLEPGTARRVTVELPWRRFAHWDEGGWAVEPGAFRLVAGLSSADDQTAIELVISSVFAEGGVPVGN